MRARQSVAAKKPRLKTAAARKAESPANTDRQQAVDGGAADTSVLGVRLAFHIHDVSRMRRKAYDQIMKPLGITRAQWWVLAHLSRHDGMMQTQLANVLDVGKASVGTLIERLEASGLIERRPDATDKRAKRVFMLRAAHQLMKKLTVEEAKFNERVLGGLSVHEQQELLRMLSLIKSALSEFDLAESDEEEVE